MSVSNARYGPVQLTTSAASVVSGPCVIQRIRVNNDSGAVRTFTLSIGADSASTRIFDAVNVPSTGLDIRGPFTLAGDVMQAKASGTGVTMTFDGGIRSDVPYATNFDLLENPLSEGGVWSSGLTAPNESAMQSSGGLAFGTQTGHEQQDFGLFNDSHALLLGPYAASQRGTGIIHYNGANIALAGNLEVEILLRMSIGALSTGLPFGDTQESGYEINMGQGVFGLFIQIGRWKRLNLFDSLQSGSPLTSMGIHDGDVFVAEIIQSSPTSAVINVRLQGVTIATANDNPSWLPLTGAPGVGQYRHDTVGTIVPTDYCLTRFVAESLP